MKQVCLFFLLFKLAFSVVLWNQSDDRGILGVRSVFYYNLPDIAKINATLAAADDFIVPEGDT